MVTAASVVVEKMYEKYHRFIRFFAEKYGLLMHVDSEDLYQDGCVRLVSRCQQWSSPPDERACNSLKKSIQLYLRKQAIRLRRNANRENVRLAPQSDHEDWVDMDRILGSMSEDALSNLYAREFVAELRRIIHKRSRRVLDYMLTDHGDGWVHRASRELRLSKNTVYGRARQIRDAAHRIIARAA